MRHTVFFLMVLALLSACRSDKTVSETDRYFAVYEKIAAFTYVSAEKDENAVMNGINGILAEHGFDMEEFKALGDKLFKEDSGKFLDRIGRINDKLTGGK